MAIMVKAENPQRTLLEHISIPIQKQRLRSAASSQDWSSLEKIASKTNSDEVANYALDLLADAGQWHLLTYVAFNATPGIASHGFDLCAANHRWDDAYFICKEVEDTGLKAHAEARFKRITINDVRYAAVRDNWIRVRTLAICGPIEAGKYAVNVLMDKKNWLELELVCEAAKPELVIHAFDLAIQNGKVMHACNLAIRGPAESGEHAIDFFLKEWFEIRKKAKSERDEFQRNRVNAQSLDPLGSADYIARCINPNLMDYFMARKKSFESQLATS